MDKYTLIYKDDFYALYMHNVYKTYSYRCPDNFDIVFCKDCSKEALITNINKHIKQKYQERNAIEYMGKNSGWYKEETSRLNSLYKLLEVIEQ